MKDWCTTIISEQQQKKKKFKKTHMGKPNNRKDLTRYKFHVCHHMDKQMFSIDTQTKWLK